MGSTASALLDPYAGRLVELKQLEHPHQRVLRIPEQDAAGGRPAEQDQGAHAHRVDEGDVGQIQDRKKDKDRLKLMAFDKVQALLRAPEAVYLIWERSSYEEACAYGLGDCHLLASVSRGSNRKKDWLIISNRMH